MKIITHYTKQPGGDCWTVSAPLVGGHTLIGGITGSGKSVLLNRLLGDCIAQTPGDYRLILIDPKKVELHRYAKLPHTAIYADSSTGYVAALDYALSVIDRRYKQMRRTGATHYAGTALLVVIDELADLMTTDRKQCLPKLQRIAQIGRAASVRLIACTQSPSRRTIPAELTINFQNRVALHCSSPIESRQILGSDEAETLPAFGEAYWRTASGELLHVGNIPPIDQAELQRRIDFWRSPANKGRRRLSW